jgi:hypothetical protein
MNANKRKYNPGSAKKAKNAKYFLILTNYALCFFSDKKRFSPNLRLFAWGRVTASGPVFL